MTPKKNLGNHLFNPGNRYESGFSLAEVLVAVTVIVIALVPLIMVFSQGVKQGKTPQKITVGTMLAQDLLEEIMPKKFDENPQNPDTPATLGPETGETRNGLPTTRNYDDVDDYRNYTESPPKEVDGTNMVEYTGYTRTVAVDYVSETALDTVSTSSTRFKRVRVTVTWDNGTQSTELEALKGNY
jgi:MSHA pilin protein MshD